jgi:preprotein translocase subunit SecF
MINFLRYRWLYLIISLTVIGAGLFSIFKWGYQYSIDFVGGTNLIYQVNKKVSLNDVLKILEKEKIKVVQKELINKQLYLKLSPINEKQELQIRQKLNKQFNDQIKVMKFETVGPLIGQETVAKTIIASLLAIVGILIYMSFAFHGFDYAVSAILAMIHDFLVVIGSYSLLSHFFGAEFDSMFVTALLTTMSFSVHDTIVIFDKIREYLKEEGKASIEYYANRALTETMVRSLNNSMTIVFMLLALVLLGGTTIRFFSLTLLIGTITGTYSSPFVATPLLVWLEKRRKK